MALKNLISRYIVNRKNKNNSKPSSLSSDLKKEKFENDSNVIISNYEINQEELNTINLIVWVVSLVLLLTLGVWLWNNILVELFPFVNKVKNPLQILGLIVLMNMIF